MDQSALAAIVAFKGVWALSELDVDSKVRRATHYAICLVYGQYPVWGVWTVRGKFLRFYGSRTSIAEDYPQLVWMRKMASWSLQAITNLSVELRKEELERRYHRSMKKDGVQANSTD